MGTCGIYEIRNTRTGMSYLGSSQNITKRWWMHRRDLRLGVHHNHHLQRSWEKHGAQCFTFSVLLPCPPDCLLAREQELLDQAPAGSLYNLAFLAQGGTRLGHRNTPEHNAAISRGNKGKPAWNKGGKNTWAKAAASSRVARYSNQIVAEHLDGRVLSFSHAAQAAREMGLGRTSVKNILKGYSQRTRSGWTFRYEAR